MKRSDAKAARYDRIVIRVLAGIVGLFALASIYVGLSVPDNGAMFLILGASLAAAAVAAVMALLALRNEGSS
jgi:hypothetical protein